MSTVHSAVFWLTLYVTYINHWRPRKGRNWNEYTLDPLTSSALEVIFNEMRYINLRFTYLLTYLLTY